ncbi:hypothetical protein DFH09DRAFT_1087200 [Mycena vulgaris]|nr:hypothetical protein DFH09DRAFT_1087200 [Mycena vulgaris]
MHSGTSDLGYIQNTIGSRPVPPFYLSNESRELSIESEWSLKKQFRTWVESPVQALSNAPKIGPVREELSERRRRSLQPPVSASPGGLENPQPARYSRCEELSGLQERLVPRLFPDLQGVAMGLGLGFTFVPTVSITAGHFAKRRGLASGVAFSGGVVGATVFPISKHVPHQARKA